VKFQKYKAKKVELDGVIFDSQAEAKHFWHSLKPRLEAEDISNLELQPVYRCEVNGKLICKYIADFRYIEWKIEDAEGRLGYWVVEDVKGFKTPVYNLKKKLVQALHPGTQICEISPSLYRSMKYSLPSHANPA
tara:strand:- start:283 stop:684 length:402 start_codon:yes stop_codon:yes gene_type:complete